MSILGKITFTSMKLILETQGCADEITLYMLSVHVHVTTVTKNKIFPIKAYEIAIKIWPLLFS